MKRGKQDLAKLVSGLDLIRRSSRHGHPISNLNEVVENLHHKGLLDRTEYGDYTRPNFHDAHVLGSFISRGGVITYWIALHQRRLTDQFTNKVFIKTTLRKRNTSIFGTKLQFVAVHPRKMAGIIWEGHGDKRYPWTVIN